MDCAACRLHRGGWERNPGLVRTGADKTECQQGSQGGPFDLELRSRSRREFYKLEEIGKGSFGEVLKALAFGLRKRLR